MDLRATRTNSNKPVSFEQKLCARVEKYSSRGFSFNDRVVYIDDKEIRYYSKVPKSFKRNDFKRLKSTPKMGVPTCLCEIQYPHQDWLTKKKKSNVLKLIFPMGSQMLYKIESNVLVRKSQKGVYIGDITSHAMKIGNSYKKKVEWVFVFSTPFDLQKFAKIVENITQPNKTLDYNNAPQGKKLDSALEARRLDYMAKHNIEIEKEKQIKLKTAEGGLKYDITDLVNDSDVMRQRQLIRDMELIKDKTMKEHKQNQEQKAKENEQLMKKQEKQKTFNNTIVQKRFVEETWKIKFQNYLLETLEDDNLDNAINLGIKLFELIAEFKVRTFFEFFNFFETGVLTYFQTKATLQVMNIIDELSLPPCLRSEIPKRTNYPPNLKMGSKPVPSEFIYSNSSYEIKIGIPGTAESYGLQEDGQEGLDIVEEMDVSA